MVYWTRDELQCTRDDTSIDVSRRGDIEKTSSPLTGLIARNSDVHRVSSSELDRDQNSSVNENRRSALDIGERRYPGQLTHSKSHISTGRTETREVRHREDESHRGQKSSFVGPRHARSRPLSNLAG